MHESLKEKVYRRLAVRGPVTLGARFRVGPGSRIWAPKSLHIEDDVYIGKWCTIEVDGCIGAGTLIANSVGIIGRRDHDMRQIGVPMRSATWVGDADAIGLNTAVTIGRDVWVGYGAVILAPVSIGRGAVVAAGAVVISDVAPYSVVAGNPAGVVANRFSSNAIAEHERIISSTPASTPPPRQRSIIARLRRRA